jgi:anti-sigma regulatory factor (Ser/Thr protein kinase)
MRRVSKRFDSSPEHVEPIRLECEAMAREQGFTEREVGEIGLCVNEAIANIIEHAYAEQPGRPIEFEAWADGGEFRAKIRDWGNGVDPTKLPRKEKDPYEPGGLGLICMREMMDSAEYAPQPDGGMLLTLAKKVKSEKQGGNAHE